MNRRIALRGAALAAFALASIPSFAATQDVNLYTTREPGLIQPLLDAFTKDTKIKVNSIFIKDGLAERVHAEGANSPRRRIDDRRYRQPARYGRPRRHPAGAVGRAVVGDPAHLRDKDGYWYALSLRARLVYASKDRVKGQHDDL
jgi:iron(III) transport system substrate-binding protein